MGMNNRDGWPCPYFYFFFLTILCQFQYNRLKMKELINTIQLIKFD